MGRSYPYYAGRQLYRGKPKPCACCELPATHIVTIQLSIFRGDDGSALVCEHHAMLAKNSYNAFCDEVEKRTAYVCERIHAQHDETGRIWEGERRALPPRYREIQVTQLGDGK